MVYGYCIKWGGKWQEKTAYNEYQSLYASFPAYNVIRKAINKPKYSISYGDRKSKGILCVYICA